MELVDDAFITTTHLLHPSHTVIIEKPIIAAYPRERLLIVTTNPQYPSSLNEPTRWSEYDRLFSTDAGGFAP